MTLLLLLPAAKTMLGMHPRRKGRDSCSLERNMVVGIVEGKGHVVGVVHLLNDRSKEFYVETTSSVLHTTHMQLADAEVPRKTDLGLELGERCRKRYARRVEEAAHNVDSLETAPKGWTKRSHEDIHSMVEAFEGSSTAKHCVELEGPTNAVLHESEEIQGRMLLGAEEAFHSLDMVRSLESLPNETE